MVKQKKGGHNSITQADGCGARKAGEVVAHIRGRDKRDLYYNTPKFYMTQVFTFEDQMMAQPPPYFIS